MRRIVHLSDLHFGKDRADLAAPLLAQVADLGPDLVAVSGDLTQRARNREFAAARAFLDRLPQPVIVVPGNHDVLLDRPLRRLLAPWRRYRRHISPTLEPRFADGEVVVVGVNTVDPLRWQTGRLSAGRLRRACAAMAGADGRACIVVAHHPLEHPETTRGQRNKKPIPGSKRALRRLLDCGADVILSGHLHAWHVGTFASAAGDPAAPGLAVQVHAGTGLSTRLRGEENDFNVVDIHPDRIVVTRHASADGSATFAPAGETVFPRAALQG